MTPLCQEPYQTTLKFAIQLLKLCEKNVTSLKAKGVGLTKHRNILEEIDLVFRHFRSMALEI